MKLWDKLKTVFQPKNFNTANYREMSLFASSNPNSPATFELSQQELLSLSYFTKGVQIIAQDIAKTTWVVQKLDAKGNWVNYDFSKLHFLLNRSPSKYLSAFEFKKMIVWNLFLYGKAPIYVHYEKQEDGKYRLLDLIPIYPNWCFKEWNTDENKFEYKIFTRQLGMSEHDINVEEPIIVQDDEIIWIDYEMIQGVLDVHFSSLFKTALTKLKENELTLINAIKNDTGSSIIVKVPDVTNRTQRDEIQNALNQAIAAQKRHGSVVFVGDLRWEIQSGNLSTPKIDYTTRNAVGREAASMLGLPPSKLGIEDSNKYNSLVERHKAYVEECLRPILNNIVLKLTNFFFPYEGRQRIAVRQLDLISLDTKTLQEFAASAINNGYATPNEIRSLFGFDYHKDGDILMANGTLNDIGITRAKAKVELEQMKLNLKNQKASENNFAENQDENQDENPDANEDENDEKKVGKK